MTVLTLCAMLLLSLLSSGYLLLVSQPRVSSYTEMTRDARLMHEAMLDQETGLRGWLATGDRRFLTPYDSGRGRTVALSNDLLDRSAFDASITRKLVPVLLEQQRWHAWAQNASGWLVDDEDRSTGRVTDVLVRGKDLFDAYRLAEQTSTANIVAKRDHALQVQRAALGTSLAATLFVLALAGLQAARRRRRLERTIITPMDQLLATIRTLHAGDLWARVEPTGVSELDVVGAALAALADDLDAADEVAAARESRLALLAERLETVIRVARETSGSLNIRYVCETVASAAADLLGAPTVVWIRDDEGQFRAARRSVDPHGAVPPSDLAAPALVATVAADARPSNDGDSHAFPLVLAGIVIGVLQAATADVDDDTGHVLEALLSTAAAAMESARLHSSAREMAELDALTHLPNRRRMEDDLGAEWERCRRYNRALTFVMLDLDHFKRLNDTFGHLAGDTVLKAAADAVAMTLRGTDTAYRYGGEEFAVLLRETELDEALLVAERLREAVGAVQVPGCAANVSASLGLAQAGSGMLHHSELIAAADEALYAAKRQGRDRVCASAGLLQRL